MTLHQLLKDGTNRLLAAGIAEAQLDARRLLMEAFHLDDAHFLLNRMEKLKDTEETAAMAKRYGDMIEERSRRVPIQYILGSQEFMGLTFQVNPKVLIPRQDTETLVELVLEQQQNPRKKVLDLCTGSGCIAVSLAILGKYCDVTATDLSAEALQTARENTVHLMGLQGKEGCRRTESGQRIRFCQGDLFDALPPGETYDILVSNPPYIPTDVIAGLLPEVRECEPRMALDGTEDGLAFYRRIASEAGAWLNPGAAIYLEIGYDQGEAVSSLLREAGFQNIKIRKDLPGLDRVVYADYIVEKG